MMKISRNKCLIGLLGAFLGVGEAKPQLAITEVMSSASTNLGSALVVPGSDFWELSNFGTNTIDLTGYGFSDRGQPPSSAPFEGLSIAPGESIVFVRGMGVRPCICARAACLFAQMHGPTPVEWGASQRSEGILPS